MGKWTGTLRIETQDSYRGNNAKGDHRVLSEMWIFDIPADQKTVSFHRAASTGPATQAALVHTSEDTLTWAEKTKASASVPYDEFDGNGRKIGTGVRIRDDYDATWTMHATSDTTASLVCESKRENIYARITDAHITGTLKKDEKPSGTAAPAHPSSPESAANATPNDINAQKLTKVFVKKYGFSVLLPTEFFPDAALQLADPKTDRLVSVKGCFRVAFSLLSGPVKHAYDNCIAEFRKKANHTTIDYKVLKDTWFVVSGDSDTTGYYTKGVKRGDNVIVMELEYTGSACNIPDAMLTEISRKFDGN